MNASCKPLSPIAAAAMLAGLLLPMGAEAQPAALTKRQIQQQHDIALKKCEALKNNAKKICEAEADGQKSVVEAQAAVMARDSPKNRLKLAEAKADAEFEMTKARCDDQVGEAKDACRRNAKSVRDQAREQAKRDSQSDTRSPADSSTDSRR